MEQRRPDARGKRKPPPGREPLGGGLHDLLTVGTDDIHSFGSPNGIAATGACIFSGAGGFGVLWVFRLPCSMNG